MRLLTPGEITLPRCTRSSDKCDALSLKRSRPVSKSLSSKHISYISDTPHTLLDFYPPPPTCTHSPLDHFRVLLVFGPRVITVHPGAAVLCLPPWPLPQRSLVSVSNRQIQISQTSSTSRIEYVLDVKNLLSVNKAPLS